MCEWHGINCAKDKDVKKDVIVAISLPDNQLVGGVPTQLGLLTSLQNLNLAGNNLKGTSMPSEIGRLVDLEALDLWGTSLAGELPSEIGLCTKLTMLDLEGSDLTGTVPTEIGNIKSLGTQICFLANVLTSKCHHPMCDLIAPSHLQNR
jgi:Leucine-rich repeat (LRR) protein